MTDRYSGHATTYDGQRVTLSGAECAAILEAIDKEKAAREATMPTTDDALTALCNAKTRLRELGWRDAIYCPKDGTDFAVIEYGSTGVFRAFYTGEWPDGHLIYGDCAAHPNGAMFKPLADLTDAERLQLKSCEEAERQMMERVMRAFSQELSDD